MSQSQPVTDERLLAAARRVFAEQGIERATLERIAREAGVSRATLHRRGVTKEAMLAGLLDRAVAEYQRAMWPALTSEGTARERLELALEALCAVAEEHLALLAGAGAVSDAIFHEEGTEALTRSPFTDPLERLLRDGAAEGSLRDVDAREAATVLFNVVGQSYIHLRAGHGWNPDRARSGVIDLCLRGLLRC